MSSPICFGRFHTQPLHSSLIFFLVNITFLDANIVRIVHYELLHCNAILLKLTKVLFCVFFLFIIVRYPVIFILLSIVLSLSFPLFLRRIFSLSFLFFKYSAKSVCIYIFLPSNIFYIFLYSCIIDPIFSLNLRKLIS